MHRCLWLVFSYYVQDTYGEVDILTSDFYFHSVTVITDCIDCNAQAQHRLIQFDVMQLMHHSGLMCSSDGKRWYRTSPFQTMTQLLEVS